MLKLYNSLNDRLEEFEPIDKNNIKMYACGITVYDKPHLGHAKTYITCDILFRLLKQLYGNVTYVRNITDVDDKINKRAVERGITIQALTNEIIEYCNIDMDYIGNLKPTVEPKATEHIKEIIDIINRLIDNEYAYISEGHVLFDVRKYKDYGKLSNKRIDDLISGARIEIESYKRDPLDFVLWKPSLDIDDKSSIFDSPWSKGRPGWHIECSAMSHKYLGENFDIHCGGADLKFPHHENEIAQSRCAFLGSNFANYWFHIGFLMVNGEKMSKSLGNFTTIEQIRNKGINGKVIRFAMLKTHYRKPLNFTDNLIADANKNLIDLHKNVIDIEENKNIPEEIIEALCDDLNTPKVIAALNEFNKNKEFSKLKSALKFLNFYDEALLKKNKNLDETNISESEIKRLIDERKMAKSKKDCEKYDEIRDYLLSKKIKLIDSKDNTTWEII